MEASTYNDLNAASCRKICIKNKYPEFYKFLMENYPLELSFSERLFWYYNELVDYPRCPECNSRTGFINFKVGYSLFCSRNCMNKSDITKKKRKQTCLERYGVTNTMKNKDVQTKIKQTCLERYGTENPFSNEEVKQKICKTNIEKYGVKYPMQSEIIKEKSVNTCIEKYGVEYPSQHDDVKYKIRQTNNNLYGGVGFASKELADKTRKTIFKKYGVENYAKSMDYKDYMHDVQNSDEYRVKMYNTKKKNHTFGSSKIEQEFRNWLDINNIEYKYQYRSEQYPFTCDFYFPSQDLYLEIQGSWVHGSHPYNPESQDDTSLLNIWRSKNTSFYNSAIKTWTISDPQKRRWVKEHGLNWQEIFSIDLKELINFYQKYLEQHDTRRIKNI